MPQPTYRYPWPASAINPKDMALLHSVRESTSPRVPISVLVARAVRAAYGLTLKEAAPNQSKPPQERNAA